MLHATKLGGRGRIVIPVEYRKALGLRPGDKVWLAMEDGTFVSRLAPARVNAPRTM